MILSFLISFLMQCFCWSFIETKPFPLQFCISEKKIVSSIPEKVKDFATIIPGDLRTYIYQTETDYYEDYQKSYFAITRKKGGWDCLRHYEILANGCIPYFVDLDGCHPETMIFFPKELVKEAMSLPGVSYLKIDHNKFNKERYYEILNKLLDHTRMYLTTRVMAAYLLDSMQYKGNGNILFLSQDTAPDYLRCCMLIGLKELLPGRVIDVPKINHIYSTYAGNTGALYGKGFTYTKIVDDEYIDRENIENRIQKKEFDFIIYGSIHRGLPFHKLISRVYEKEKILYICGEDKHDCPYTQWPNFFLREYDTYNY